MCVGPQCGPDSIRIVANADGNPEVGTVGGQRFMRARGTWPGGIDEDVTDVATWQSSNSAVATLDRPGHVIVMAPGTATISATHLGVTGSYVQTVVGR